MSQPITDIFQWANKIDGMKRDLQVELFLVSKHFTPYSIRRSSELETQISPVFMFNLISEITLGAGTGLAVRELAEYEPKQNMIAYEPLENVGRAATLLHTIEEYRNDIVEFSQEEHTFKRMQAIVAIYTHPVDRDVKFYVIKMLKPAAAISDGVAWQIRSGQLEPLGPDVALKMPIDNQMVVIGGEIFIFNEPNFVKLFHYDLQMIKSTDERGAALTKQYKLSMPDLFDDFAKYVRDNRSNVKKLMDVDLSNLMEQDTLLEIADAMAIELMTDDAGAIILFDNADVAKFLDLINDNYLSSETGNHYLAKSKKQLEQ